MKDIYKLAANILRCTTFEGITFEVGAVVCQLRNWCPSDAAAIDAMLELRAELISHGNHRPLMDYAIQRLDYLFDSCFQVKPLQSDLGRLAELDFVH